MRTVTDQRYGALVCYAADEAPKIMIVLCCGHEIGAMLPDLLKGLTDCAPFVLVSPIEVSWDRDYTPWPSDELPGRSMSGNGAAFYRRLIDNILPAVRKDFPSIQKNAVAGYSLGGLFALWAALQSDAPFESAASVSGALWYEGFADYARREQNQTLKRVYLSLGRKEAGTARGAMGRVSDATQGLNAALRQRLGDNHVCFEWNNGNHFFEIPQRLAKAISWICKP